MKRAMTRRMGKPMGKIIALVASLALVVGLMPLPAFGEPAATPGEGPSSEASQAVVVEAATLTSGNVAEASDERAADAVAAEPEDEAPAAEAEPGKAEGAEDAGDDAEAGEPGKVTEPERREKVGDGTNDAVSDEPDEGKDDAGNGEGKDDGSKEAKGEKAEFPAFYQSEAVDGVTVTVEADAGALPEGAWLSVESVPSAKTEAAVAPERDAGANVAASKNEEPPLSLGRLFVRERSSAMA